MAFPNPTSPAPVMSTVSPVAHSKPAQKRRRSLTASGNLPGRPFLNSVISASDNGGSRLIDAGHVDARSLGFCFIRRYRRFESSFADSLCKLLEVAIIELNYPLPSVLPEQHRSQPLLL